MKNSDNVYFRSIILACFATLCCPGIAYAALVCLTDATTGNSVPSQPLYDMTKVCPGYGSLQLWNIFSSLSCDFQSILSDVMSRMYCGIQASFRGSLAIAITLYIAFYGIMFNFGMAQLTVGEVVSRLLRIALVWVFATQAAWGVGYVYGFLMSAIDTSTSIVMKLAMGNVQITADPSLQVMTTMQVMDVLIYNQINGPFSSNGYKLIGFFSVLSYAMPPVFMLFLYFLIKSIVIFVRVLITYLLGISAIAFLVALGPIFVSFALFKFTYSFFESWLRYLMSFTLQIILNFAGVAVFIYVIQLSGGFFTELATHVSEYDEIWWAEGVRSERVSWGYCIIPGCSDPAPPSRWIFIADLIYYVITNLITLTIVLYAFDTLIKNIPNLARELSGPKYAPILGGGHGFGAVNLPGLPKTGGSAREIESRTRLSKPKDPPPKPQSDE